MTLSIFQVSYCNRLDSSKPDWTSGESRCEKPQCWIQGQCLGETLDIERVENVEACLAKCKSKSACYWFTFFKPAAECIQFKTCPAIDDTCTDCISGERSCIAGTKPTPTGKLQSDDTSNCYTIHF